MRTILAFVAAAVIAAPAVAQVQQQERAGIRNFSRVDATVSCSGAIDPTALPDLKRDGFVSVINLRLPDEPGANVDASRVAAAGAGLRYIHLPFNAAAPDPQVVDRFLSAVADPLNQPVLVHCGTANRVGAVWMIKRVLQDGWAIERARAEAEAIGLRSPELAAFAMEYIRSHRR